LSLEIDGDRVGAGLSPWRIGTLDIHHIATGRGDAVLVVGPDGTTLLVDAGAVDAEPRYVLPARPDDTRHPGGWIARYVRRRLAETGDARLDYALVTHLHPDHVGAPVAASPLAPNGAYRLTGVSEVEAAVGVHRLIDPDFPDYGYPRFETRETCENYVAFVRDRAARGEPVERFIVGRNDQIGLAHGGNADFEIRNLAGRGRVWTGRGDDVRDIFPSRADLPESDHPNENASSLGIRLRYGAFDYFCGGDLTDWADGGARPWMDALTPAAEAAGPVDAALAPHHGLFDANGAAMVRALAPRVWIISAWHAAHPSPSTLQRLFNARLYPGPRDIYATGASDATECAAPSLFRRLASSEGHVVLRVAPEGRSFRVVVTDSRGEDDRVTHVSEAHFT
jgi:beta-lactamase superfamily II metal-dependent hydrolase